MSFLTVAGEEQLASKQFSGNTVNITHFVLAYISDLGDEPEDRVEALPDDSLIVYTREHTDYSYVNGNQVVYSLVMDSTVGDFEFNWIGLVDDEGVLIAVAYITTITKRQSANGVEGNTIARNFLLKYTGIQNITGATVPAETWQLDFSTRMSGIDERERLSNYDIFGHDSFLDDACLVSGSKGSYQVASGVGYVGGIRVKFSDEQTVAVDNTPSAIWLDVSLQGDVSDLSTVVSMVVSDKDQADYTDDNGITHYLTKLADIASNGGVTDSRSIYENVAQHEAKADPHPQYKTYTDELVSNALTSAETDASDKTDTALTSAKTYTDGLDAENVKLTGAQTVAGRKTFSTAPRSSVSPTNDADLARKDYVDDQASNADNLTSGTVADDRLPTDLARTGADGQEFGDQTVFNGANVFFGGGEHSLFNNDGHGNAGIRLGCHDGLMTIDGGAVEFQANIDDALPSNWVINLSEGGQSIGDTVSWSDYQLRGSADGTFTWGGENILTEAEVGTAAYEDVTSTTEPTTSGEIPKIGDWNFFSTYPALWSGISDISDWDDLPFETLPDGAVLRINGASGWANKPDDIYSSSNYRVSIEKWASTWGRIVVTHINTVNEVFSRTIRGGTWSDWAKITTDVTTELTGSIHFFATEVLPGGFVKANGAELQIDSYPELYAKIGTTFGGDGVDTFQVPDLRGEFVRGWDDGRGVDAGRAFGSSQLDQMQRLMGVASFLQGTNSVGSTPTGVFSYTGEARGAGGGTDRDSRTYTFDSAGSDNARVSDDTTGETRPRNIALAAYIKY